MSTHSWLVAEDGYGYFSGVYVHMDGYPERAKTWIVDALISLGRSEFVKKFITSRTARNGWSALYNTDPTKEPSGNVTGYGQDGRPVAFTLRTDVVEDTMPVTTFYKGVAYSMYTEERPELWKCYPDDMGAAYAYLIRLDGSIIVLESVSEDVFKE